LKLFSVQWIERPARSLLTAGSVAIVAVLALALPLVSCVSEPPATPETGLQAASQATEPAVTPGAPVASESQSVREVPLIISSMRIADPPPHVVIATLAEPDLPPPPVLPPVIPTEITVLSTMPAPVAAVTAAALPPPLPEPIVPAPALAAPAKVATAPAAKPALSEPKAVAPAKPTATATKPATAAPVKAETPKTAEPAPAAAPAVVPAPAVVLPATPPSQARSVDAAKTQPVAETRIETVRGERFELRFPGTGWIYLGDEEGKEGLRYETRRFESTQAVFAMNPETVGEYLLRFQRQNPVDQATETSLVRVVVTERSGFSTATAAPETPGNPPATTTATAAATAVVPAAGATSPAVPGAEEAPAVPAATALPVDPASLIKLAKTELEAKRIQAAIEVLDRYLALYPYGNDEVFYLYGLAYEQDTPFRDIKKSWEYYRRVKDDYPRSARWTAAADRVAYLEKHYFGLR